MPKALSKNIEQRAILVALFAVAGLFVIGILARFRQMPIVPEHEILAWQYAFLAVIAAVILISFLKRLRSRVLWEVMFTVTLFLGVWYALMLVLPFAWALAIASALTLAHLFLRIVAVHNLFYLIGAAGVAIDFAGWLPPDVLLAGLAVFTLYDTVAGPPGGPIESLAASLIEKGIVPGAIVPTSVRGFFTDIDDAVKSNAALLGAGDLILPLTLVAAGAFRSTHTALIILAGLLVGATVLGRSGTHARTALPALAVGAALPFVILRLLSLV